MKDHEHTPQAIRERLRRSPELSYLRDWVYGGIDGAVTTFAVVSGVTGANLASSTIIILGLANLVADGFSMAASNYVGTRTEHEERHTFAEYERQQIESEPEGEKEEVRQILIAKGFSGPALDAAVDVFVSDRDKWIELMLQEEYGLAHHLRSPFKAALATFTAFGICGAVPLLPYFFSWDKSFGVASLLTAVTFFLIGSLKSRWSTKSWWSSGLGTLLIGGIAASLAYLVGWLIQG